MEGHLPAKVLNFSVKNCEANISNQTFSFIFSSARSKHTLSRILQGEEHAERCCLLYYLYINTLRKIKKSYVNRRVILKLTHVDSALIKSIVVCSSYNEAVLPIDKFCRLTRILLRYYLSLRCQLAIITSKKLSK